MADDTIDVLCATGVVSTMANGFFGSEDEWERVTTPLERLDPVLEKFAAEKGLTLGKNAKNWPDREFRWEDTLRRLIQIYLEDQEQLTWTLWICASEDRSAGRYWKQQTLIKAVPIEDLESQLPGLLKSAWMAVRQWTASDLVPA